jgi:hypothetical protein
VYVCTIYSAPGFLSQGSIQLNVVHVVVPWKIHAAPSARFLTTVRVSKTRSRAMYNARVLSFFGMVVKYIWGRPHADLSVGCSAVYGQRAAVRHAGNVHKGKVEVITT